MGLSHKSYGGNFKKNSDDGLLGGHDDAAGFSFIFFAVFDRWCADDLC